MPIFKEITCKTACNKLKRNFPYTWDLNIYRGCEHGCKYCFAIYSHDYMGSGDYFGEIFVKTNIVERLEAQLSSRAWKGERINIGGVTDSYQNAEAKYKFMPDILKLLIKYKTPCVISTKSELILRDFDLIAELANITRVNIASTITCADDNLQSLVEPNASPTSARFKLLEEFAKTNATRGVHCMPIMPYLTDSYENIETIYANAAKIKATYVLEDVLNLRGATRTVFLEFFQKEFPKDYQKIIAIYRNGYADYQYKEDLYKKVNEIRIKYGFKSS